MQNVEFLLQGGKAADYPAIMQDNPAIMQFLSRLNVSGTGKSWNDFARGEFSVVGPGPGHPANPASLPFSITFQHDWNTINSAGQKAHKHKEIMDALLGSEGLVCFTVFERPLKVSPSPLYDSHKPRKKSNACKRFPAECVQPMWATCQR